MPYKNILVAVDTTDEAEDVIRAAREVAKDEGCTISAVTVIRPMADFYVSLYSTLEDISDTGIESQAVERATAWLSDLLERHGVEAGAVKVALGAPAAEIRRSAEDIDADLIVMGTHGRHGLGLILGSTASAVLHGAPCDVLAVKVHAEESDQSR
jgi:universal stress protein A